MRSNIHSTLLPALACLCFASPAFAQKATQQVAMKIDVVSWGETIPGLSIKSGKAGVPVTALAFRYSKPVTYVGPNILEISRNSATAPAAPAAAATPAAPEAPADPEDPATPPPPRNSSRPGSSAQSRRHGRFRRATQRGHPRQTQRQSQSRRLGPPA